MMMETFYRDHYSTVYGYLLSLGADPATAEDLTAEVFLRAMQKASSFDGGCKITTWLCTIGRNLYFNEHRRQKRYTSLEENVHPADSSVEEEYIENDLANRILLAAQGMESPYREVFFMRLEDLPFRQIGEAFGKTESWARVTFFRAKAKIVSEMGEQHG